MHQALSGAGDEVKWRVPALSVPVVDCLPHGHQLYLPSLNTKPSPVKGAYS